MRERELEAVQAVQSHLARGPLPAVARALSHWGEHGLGWYGLAAVGAVVDGPRRRRWLAVGVSAFTAHAAAVVVKRLVRRPRPEAEQVRVLVSTPSALSFPSAHATSTAAAAAALVPLVGPVPAWGALGLMGLSRVLLGVHFPLDVVGGAALGIGVERLVRRAAR